MAHDRHHTQAHSSNPKHHAPISPSRRRYVRNVLMVLNRENNNGLPCFSNDTEGQMRFVVSRSLGLPDNQVDQVAPWRMEMTPQQRQSLDTAQFVPTPINIGIAINLTCAKRDELANKRNSKGKRSL